MARFFNTEGPVRPLEHYCVPPLRRIDLDHVLALIDRKKYFVLHAPRQTGKTTCLLALADHLNRRGTCSCLYVNVEAGQAARDDVSSAMRAVLGQLASCARDTLGDLFLAQHWTDVLDTYGGFAALEELLGRWARSSAKPLVLVLDEVDSLVGDTLISLLRQLRTGYPKRPLGFPQSVILCGVRDVRDYRLHSAADRSVISGGSAFNIKAESLRLGDFTYAEVRALYLQHTKESGQAFGKAALDRVWYLTRGQPWLVNALGSEVCAQRGRSVKSVTEEMVENAKEALITRRVTHLDQLGDKLKEERVRHVIEPLLGGRGAPRGIPEDDIAYVQDLGLIRIDGELTIANPLYREVLPRQLTYSTQVTISQQPAWYVLPDGRLDVGKLITAFQEFFRENSESWIERFDYKEAGPQLLVQAFLQRVINGGGRIEREYGLGRGRTDLLVLWPHRRGTQKAAIELKVRHKSLERTIAEGLEQTAEYMDRTGSSSEGHLIIFDRDPRRTWEQKIFHRRERIATKVIQLWGM